MSVGNGGLNNRNVDQDVGQRVRVTVSQDTRQQTAYGTLRTYLILGWTHDTPANTTSPAAPGVYFNRGFIQIAGFTFGKATSFFDFASTAAVAYNAGFVTTSDTGDAGQIVGAYTAQFGNGVSGTIGIEQSAGATVYASSQSFLVALPRPHDNLGGNSVGTVASFPDVVANCASTRPGVGPVAGALHDVSAAYYGW